MTDIKIIDGTQHAKCQLCGKVAELRPYGPGGKSICFECAMKDEEGTDRRFKEFLKGTDILIIK